MTSLCRVAASTLASALTQPLCVFYLVFPLGLPEEVEIKRNVLEFTKSQQDSELTSVWHLLCGSSMLTLHRRSLPLDDKGDQVLLPPNMSLEILILSRFLRNKGLRKNL